MRNPTSTKCWLPTMPRCVIGDPALQIDRSRYITLDLAEEWIRYTGKPFVFAFWAVRQDALREANPAQDSGDDLPAIARSWARSREPRSDRRGVGSAAWAHSERGPHLSHRKYLLPAGRAVSRRPAAFLSLRCRNRRAAGRAAHRFSARAKTLYSLIRASTCKLSQPACFFIFIPGWP